MDFKDFMTFDSFPFMDIRLSDFRLSSPFDFTDFLSIMDIRFSDFTTFDFKDSVSSPFNFMTFDFTDS